MSSLDVEIEEPCVELECHSDVSEALPEQGSGLLYILEKYYSDSKVEIDPLLTKQSAKGGKDDAKVKQRAKIKAALKLVLPDVRAQWKKLKVKYSRQQLIESLIPAAGQKGAAKKLIEAGTSLSCKKASVVKKAVEKHALKETLKKLCSAGSKSFFIKFKAALTPKAPKSLKAAVEDDVAVGLPVPPLPPPADLAAGVENELFPMYSEVRVVVEDASFKSHLGQAGKVKASYGDDIEVCFNNY